MTRVGTMIPLLSRDHDPLVGTAQQFHCRNARSAARCRPPSRKNRVQIFQRHLRDLLRQTRRRVGGEGPSSDYSQEGTSINCCLRSLAVENKGILYVKREQSGIYRGAHEFPACVMAGWFAPPFGSGHRRSDFQVLKGCPDAPECERWDLR